ncbi:hypothetical protein M0802_012448 [Mischocyttarus mexicanus]|nr:hypothetical protein M0802_012448 [Mischocyttarus mexicanus]
MIKEQWWKGAKQLADVTRSTTSMCLPPLPVSIPAPVPAPADAGAGAGAGTGAVSAPANSSAVASAVRNCNAGQPGSYLDYFEIETKQYLYGNGSIRKRLTRYAKLNNVLHMLYRILLVMTTLDDIQIMVTEIPTPLSTFVN